MWTSDDPGAGIPGHIADDATHRRTMADTLVAEVTTTLLEATSWAGSPDWTARTAEAYAREVALLQPEIDTLTSMLETDAAALHSYAVAVDQIAHEATVLRVEREALTAELASDRRYRSRYSGEVSSLQRISDALFTPLSPSSALQRRPAEVVAEETRINKLRLEQERGLLRVVELRIAEHEAGLRRLDQRRGALEQRRTLVDCICMNALSGGTSRGNLIRATRAARGDISAEQFLTLTEGLSVIEVITLLKQRPTLNPLGMEPSPTQVAEFWARYARPAGSDGRSPEQELLLSTFPALFGNLVGIPFWARDLANRQVVSELSVKLEALSAQLIDAEQNEGKAAVNRLLAANQYTRRQFDEQLAAVRAIEASLEQSDGLVYQLIEFRPQQRPPLAAISVGDLDIADHVTVAVPGMDSTVGNSMENWTKGAKNIYDEQAIVPDKTSPTPSRAVVAWLGYHTPAALPSLEVLSMAKAHAGAVRLQGLLEGVTATRSWAPGENLAIAAHSYGSTTAATALCNTPVESFVMFGSAGTDPFIGHSYDLMVPEDMVFATSAEADITARAGIAGSYRANPETGLIGAESFSSEEQLVPNSEPLRGVTDHGILKNSATTADEFGYLDRGTNSLRGIAYRTLGLTP